MFLHYCSCSCILGALLGPHAPLEPPQHMWASLLQKGKKRTGTKKLFCFGPTAARRAWGGFTGQAAHVCRIWAPSRALVPWKEALWLPAVAPAVHWEEEFSSSARRLPDWMLEGVLLCSSLLGCSCLMTVRGGCWGWWCCVRQWLSNC